MTATNFAALNASTGEPLDLPESGARSEFVRYFVCSTIALFADVTVYWVSLRLGFTYPAAAAAGFCMGLFAAYTLSVRWAFRTRRVNDPHIEFLLFAGIGILGLGLTELLLWALVGKWNQSPLVAKAVTAGVVFGFNFGLRKVMLFTRSNTEVAL